MDVWIECSYTPEPEPDYLEAALITVLQVGVRVFIESSCIWICLQETSLYFSQVKKRLNHCHFCYKTN